MQRTGEKGRRRDVCLSADLDSQIREIIILLLLLLLITTAATTTRTTTIIIIIAKNNVNKNDFF